MKSKSWRTTALITMIAAVFLAAVIGLICSFGPGRSSRAVPIVVRADIPYGSQFADLLNEEVLGAKPLHWMNPCFARGQPPDLKSLRKYAIRIVPTSGFSLLPEITIAGEDLYAAVTSRLEASRFRSNSHLQRVVVRELLSHADSMLLDSYIKHNGLVVEETDFEALMQDIESGKARAYVLTYKNPNHVLTDQLVYRRIFESTETQVEPAKALFMQNCISTIQFRLGAHLLGQQSGNSGLTFSEPIRDGLLAHLRKNCQLVLTIPDLDCEFLLDIYLQARLDGINLVLLPAGQDRALWTRCPTSQAVPDVHEVDAKDVAAIQKHYASTPMRAMAAVKFSILADKALDEYSSGMTLWDDDRFGGIEATPLTFKPNMVVKECRYYDGAGKVLSIDPARNAILKHSVPHGRMEREYTKIERLDGRIVREFHKATRTRYIKSPTTEFAVFEFEEGGDIKGSKVVQSYYISLVDYGVVKLKEVSFRDGVPGGMDVYLIQLVVPPRGVSYCLDMLGGFFEQAGKIPGSQPSTGN